MSTPLKIELAAKKYPACFTAFDILYYEDHPVTDLPLTERKALLQKAVIEESARFAVSRVVENNGVAFFLACQSAGAGGHHRQTKGQPLLFRQTHEGLDQVQEPKGCGLRRLRLSSEGKRQNQPRPRTVCRRNADIQRACDTRRLRRELPQDTGAAEA